MVIIALLDLLVDTISFYIESIQDPLYSFIEFNMRYCIFRNIILSLEVFLVLCRKNWVFCLKTIVHSVGRFWPKGMRWGWKIKMKNSLPLEKWLYGIVDFRNGISTCKGIIKHISKASFICWKNSILKPLKRKMLKESARIRLSCISADI